MRPKSDCMKHCENIPKPAMDETIFIPQNRHTASITRGSIAALKAQV